MNTLPSSRLSIHCLANGDTLETQCYGQDPEWNIPSFDAGSITATDVCGGEVTITYTRSLEDEGDCSEDGYINLVQIDMDSY